MEESATLLAQHLLHHSASGLTDAQTHWEHELQGLMADSENCI